MTLFSMARPLAFKVPRAQALPTRFRPNCCNRVISHEREWLVGILSCYGQPFPNPVMEVLPTIRPESV
jgi:hypothetical protein